jgi:hypothetical protein
VRGVAVVLALGMAAHAARAQTPAPASQNPSPMVEHTRAHGRLEARMPDGISRTFTGPQAKPAVLFIPAATKDAGALRLVVSFLGAAFVPAQAVASLGGNHVVAAINIGAGSGTYDRAFSDPAVFDTLLATIARETTAAMGKPASFREIILVGFSAGHGAIRAILRDSSHFAKVDAILLLDGMHTSYVPEGTVMEKGGTLDERNLEGWVRFGRAATRGEKRFVVTHSEIFPGTFASTTETADYLVQQLGLKRVPVLKWGPRGMQQLSEVMSGGLAILGFAGNTAPDHIDQLHAMPELLRMVMP